MPKIVVSGRGGSGKSTITTLLSRRLATDGRVTVIDADESNLSLPLMLGVEQPSSTIVEHVGGREAVRGALMEASRPGSGERVPFFANGVTVAELPLSCKSGGEGLTFVRIGKIEHALQGCACPEGALARAFIGRLDDGDGWLFVDTEAGVEHFGRGLLESVDLVLLVVDASHEAVLLAEKAAALAAEAGKRSVVVLNQVDPETEAILRDALRSRRLEVVGALPSSTAVARAQLLGEPLDLVDEVREPLDELLRALIVVTRRQAGADS